MLDSLTLWRRYKDHYCDCATVGIGLDISRMTFDEGFFARMQEPMERAYQAMSALESGEIANPDEKRMVGHYWLRAPHLAPTQELIDTIEKANHDLRAFVQHVHDGTKAPPTGVPKFTDVLVVGIGGSALGPQLVADALGNLGAKRDRLRVHFLDNTDADGFDRVLEGLGARLKSTMVVVISKSGGTKETRNGMMEAEHMFKTRGLMFNCHAVAVTGPGSQLDQYAEQQKWVARFPMWDWVGGRTSLMSAVGLLPMALQGLDIAAFLDGAAEMDKLTRLHDTKANPAARLALMWYWGTGGRGTAELHGGQATNRDMVVLPYKDRLLLLSRYLQQLVMESLGKELDLDGKRVEQGLAVYGNKGSTDQHAYVQQLRDGVNNFFAMFLVVLQDRAANKLVGNALKSQLFVDPGTTSGDYLSGFWQGTRSALYEKGRQSMTLFIEKLDARSLGAVIALYERAVGLYATLINVNAYHQPGVEAGKKAATAVLDLQAKVVAYLKENPDAISPDQLADRMGASDRAETIHHILTHLVVNKRGVVGRGNKFRWKA